MEGAWVIWRGPGSYGEVINNKVKEIKLKKGNREGEHNIFVSL